MSTYFLPSSLTVSARKFRPLYIIYLSLILLSLLTMRGLPLDSSSSGKRWRVLAAALAAVIILGFSTHLFSYIAIYLTADATDLCPVWDIMRPESFYKDNSTVLKILYDSEFRALSIDHWSKAVQVDTQIYDSPPPVDEHPEAWTKFKKFHQYLEDTFPQVHTKLEKFTVNTYGLVFYWKGSDESLKPVMLTAHQDVVPVQKDTLGDWTYPPFEGHCDGEYLYGRGAADTKNVLIAIMDTLELLLSEGYEPKRGIVAAFGMDEEVSGFHGAAHISQFLEEKFGKDGIYALVDEGGGLTVDPPTGAIVAPIGTGEKGYIDVIVDLITPGGHSSVPPDHTSIGIMGELSYIIEKDPYQPIFTPKNPIFGYMQCLATHSGDKMSPLLRKSILRAGFDKFANGIVTKVMTLNLATKFLVQTSQAQDIVRGGEKVNALPESVQLTTNHRVAIESTSDEILDHFVSRVVEVAKRHELGVEVAGKTYLNATTKGNFKVSLSHEALEPAPVTPVDDNAWKHLAGSIRHIYEDFVFKNLTLPVLVTPGIMTGNTDTRHYWNLTKNIYRFTPVFMTNLIKESHAHSVDEKMGVDNHLQLTAFFYEYVQLVDSKSADN